jgi:hypothetical protein
VTGGAGMTPEQARGRRILLGAIALVLLGGLCSIVLAALASDGKVLAADVARLIVTAALCLSAYGGSRPGRWLLVIFLGILVFFGIFDLVTDAGSTFILAATAGRALVIFVLVGPASVQSFLVSQRLGTSLPRTVAQVMRLPLARFPGRRRLWSRFFPEICALAVYALGAAIFLVPAVYWDYLVLGRSASRKAMEAASLTYWAAAVILVFGPLIQSLNAWHRERSRGTAEALVLTPMDHGALVMGRYWHILLPWLRFMLWMLPLYLCLAVHPVMERIDRGNSSSWMLGGIYALGSKGLFGTMVVATASPPEDLSLLGLFLAAARWLVDVVALWLASSLGFHLSARARSRGGLAVAYVLLPLLLGTVACLNDWLMLPLDVLRRMGAFGLSRDAMAGIHITVGLLILIGSVFLSAAALRRTARNFDAYLLGEKPGSWS